MMKNRNVGAALWLTLGVIACGDDEDGTGGGGAGGGTTSTSTSTSAVTSTSNATATASASSGSSGEGGAGGAGTGGSGAGNQGGGGGTGELVRPDAGVLECDPLHVIADGTCSMEMDSCELGEIPDLLEGCSPVGVAACDDLFLVDGVCLASETLCDGGTFPVPSEGCVAIDGEAGCGSATWGAIVEEAGDVHVDPTSPVAVATGSRLAPYLTVAAALDAVDAGGRIVLAAGSYDEPIEITESIAVVGRCASMVELVGETDHEFDFVLTPTTAVYVVESAGDVALSGLRLAGPGIGLVVDGGDVTLTDVEIESVGRGLVVGGAGSVHADHLWVHDVQPNPDGAKGDGILALEDATAILRRSAFIGNVRASMVAFEAEITLEDVLVEGTLPDPDGYGIALYPDGGTIIATDVVLNGNFQQVQAYNAAVVDLVRMVIVGSTDGNYGVGVISQDGGSVSIADSIVRGNVAGGVAIFTASMTSTGNLYQGNSGGPFETDGFFLYDGSTLESVGDVVLDHAGIGYLAILTSNTATPNTLTVRRGLVEGQRGVIDTLEYGHGFTLNGGTDAEITDTVVRGNRDLGIYVGDLTLDGTLASTLEVESSRIEGTLPSEASEANGVALQVLGESQVTASRTLFLDSRGAGVHSAGASIELVECVVEGVEDNAIALGEIGLSSAEGGDAILAQGTSAEGDALSPEGFGAGVSVTDSWIDGAERAAALVHGMTATFTRTRLGGATYGVVEQEDGTAVLQASVVEDIDEENPEDTLAVP